MTTDRQPPHHNNLTCYTNYGCRLPDCKERYNTWNRARVAANKAGQQSRVDAEPVRQHLRLLAEHGISIRRAAELAGIGNGTLHPLFQRPIRHTVRPHIATKILAIDPNTATPTRIDPTGTARRIQALVAAGWPMAHLSEHLGIYRSYVHAITKRAEDRQLILAATAAKVADSYERVKAQKPHRHGIRPVDIKKARNLAASRGWPPPKYWADRMDVIDDPHFQPEYGLLRAQIIAEEAHWLMTAGGLDRGQAAARLGIARFTIDRALREHPQDGLEVAA